MRLRSAKLLTCASLRGGGVEGFESGLEEADMGGLVLTNAADQCAVEASVLEGVVVELVEGLSVESVLEMLESEGVLK